MRKSVMLHSVQSFFFRFVSSAALLCNMPLRIFYCISFCGDFYFHSEFYIFFLSTQIKIVSKSPNVQLTMKKQSQHFLCHRKKYDSKRIIFFSSFSFNCHSCAKDLLLSKFFVSIKFITSIYNPFFLLSQTLMRLN